MFMLKRITAITLIVTLVSMPGVVPTTSANPLVLGALAWVGSFLAQWCLGKALDHALGLDPWSQIPDAEVAEFQRKLAFLEDQNTAIQTRAAQFEREQQRQLDRILQLQALITEQTENRSSVYAKTLSELTQAQDSISSYPAEFNGFVRGLQSLPTLVNNRQVDEIENLGQRSTHLEKTTEQAWVEEVNRHLLSATARIDSIERRLSEAEADIDALQHEAQEHSDRLTNLEGAQNTDRTILLEHEGRLVELEDFQAMAATEDRERDALGAGPPVPAVLVPLEVYDDLSRDTYGVINRVLELSCDVSVIYKTPSGKSPFRVLFQLFPDIACIQHPGYRGLGQSHCCPTNSSCERQRDLRVGR